MRTPIRWIWLGILAAGLVAGAVPGPGAVWARSARGSSHTATRSSSKVDLNSASESELEALPGVGAVTAQKIIAGRPYSSVSDLKRAGVSDRTIKQISGRVTVGESTAENRSERNTSDRASATTRPHARGARASVVPENANGPVDLNTASEAELEALPGIGPTYARKIVEARPFSSRADVERAGVPKRTLDDLGNQVTVSRTEGAAPRKSFWDFLHRNKATNDQQQEQQQQHKGSEQSTVSDQTSRGAPGHGMVWVNTSTGIYHFEGDRWYGNTKYGKYMTEAEARNEGFRAAKTGEKGEVEQ